MVEIGPNLKELLSNVIGAVLIALMFWRLIREL